MEVLPEKKKEIRHAATYAWLQFAKRMDNIPAEIALLVAKYVWSESDNEIVVIIFFHVNEVALSVYDIETDSSILWEPAEKPYIVVEHIVYEINHASFFAHKCKSVKRRIIDQVEFDRLITNGVRMHECNYINTLTGEVVQKKQKK